MKDQLSSVDIHAISRELERELSGARVDKVFQTGKNELVIRVYGRGRKELVASDRFICMTKYKRQAPKMPSSFSMQLRKHLKSKPIIWVRQHEFERIVEVGFEGLTLVFELFGGGNALLIDEEGKIIGLCNWQKWRDRVLGVGRPYEYPPARVNPFRAGLEDVRDELSDSDKSLSSTLATRFSLFGRWAKKACEIGGQDPDEKASIADAEKVLEGIRGVCSILDGELHPALEKGGPNPYSDEWDGSMTFNEAVDGHFSSMQMKDGVNDALKVFEDERQRLIERIEGHKKLLKNSLQEIESSKDCADLIFQNMGQVKNIIESIRSLRDNGISDDEIVKSLKDLGVLKIDGCSIRIRLS